MEKESNFDFDWHITKETSAREVKDLVIHDIENHWGKECLSASASYAITLA